MNFKDKKYYLNKAKEIAVLTLTGALFAAIFMLSIIVLN